MGGSVVGGSVVGSSVETVCMVVGSVDVGCAGCLQPASNTVSKTNSKHKVFFIAYTPNSSSTTFTASSTSTTRITGRTILAPFLMVRPAPM